MLRPHFFKRRRPKAPQRKPKCGLCKTSVRGPYKSVAGKPRCFWCLKRTGTL